MAVSATVTVFAFAMMVTTSVTATCEHLDGLAHLLFCGVAILADGAREVERLACQRVVGVNGHTVFLHLHDLSHKLMILIVCQCDNGIGVDIVVIEMTIDGEDLRVELMNAQRLVDTECLFWLEDEVETVALGMLDDLLLESIEGDAKTSDKLERTL